MKINKRPKDLGTWLTMRLLLCDKEDCDLAKAINITMPTISSWKQNKNYPKIPSVLEIVKFFSDQTGESPSEIMDELLDSIPEYRMMNKIYRVKKHDQSNK
jgi:transcriptional regulator with XRE-family HTH domain